MQKTTSTATCPTNTTIQQLRERLTNLGKLTTAGKKMELLTKIMQKLGTLKIDENTDTQSIQLLWKDLTTAKDDLKKEILENKIRKDLDQYEADNEGAYNKVTHAYYKDRTGLLRTAIANNMLGNERPHTHPPTPWNTPPKINAP